MQDISLNVKYFVTDTLKCYTEHFIYEDDYVGSYNQQTNLNHLGQDSFHNAAFMPKYAIVIVN